MKLVTNRYVQSITRLFIYTTIEYQVDCIMVGSIIFSFTFPLNSIETGSNDNVRDGIHACNSI